MDGKHLAVVGVAFALVTCIGCNVTQSGRSRLLVNDSAVEIKNNESARVFVGGNEPTIVSIPKRGVSLSKIATQLKFADSVISLNQDQELLSAKQEFFISLRREAKIGHQIYYLPYEFVRSGGGGELSVKDGDVVDLIHIDEIAAIEPASNAFIVLNGLLKNPGKYSLENGAKLADVESNFTEYAGDPTAVTITRRGQGLATVEQFVIPVNSTFFNDFDLGSGDTVFFTYTEKVPLLISGLIDQINRNRSISQTVETAKRKTRTRIGKRIQSSIQYPRPLVR